MHIVITGPAPVPELSAELELPADALPRGLPGTPVIGLARQMASFGHQVTIVTCSPGVSRELTFGGARLRVRVGPYRDRHRARDAFRVEREYVAQAVKSVGADVVHAHWTYEFALGALASGTPALVTVRDWAPAILRYHPDPYRLVRLAMQVRAVRRAGHLTVTSPYLERRIRTLASVAPVLIPNAIADDAVCADPPFQASQATPRIIAVNNGWSRRKNVATLLRAFAEVRAAVPQAELELVGSGYGPGEAARRWADEQHLTGGVRFTGALSAEEVRQALSRSTLFVHPSREESFGLVLVEAMAHGRPVIGGVRSGAVPWLLQAGACGRLVDIEDPDAIARAVVQLLSKPEEAAALARRGYEHALTLTTSVVAEAYLRCYEEVA